MLGKTPRVRGPEGVREREAVQVPVPAEEKKARGGDRGPWALKTIKKGG